MKLTKAQIKKIVYDTIAEQAKIPVSRLNDKTKLDSLGMDSIDFIEITMALEEALGIEISDELAAKMVTVGDVVNYVASLQPEQQDVAKFAVRLKMAKRKDTRKAVNGIIHVIITDKKTTHIIAVKNGNYSIVKSSGIPDVTIKLTSQTLQDIKRKRLTSQKAFMNGKMNVSGNISVVMSIDFDAALSKIGGIKNGAFKSSQNMERRIFINCSNTRSGWCHMGWSSSTR